MPSPENTPCQNAWLWTGAASSDLADSGNYTLLSSGQTPATTVPLEGDTVIEAVSPANPPRSGTSPAAWTLDTDGTDPGTTETVPTFNGPVLMGPSYGAGDVDGGVAIAAGIFNGPVTLGVNALIEGSLYSEDGSIAANNAMVVFNGPVFVPADASGISIQNATFNGPLFVNAAIDMASTVALNCPAIFFASDDLYSAFLEGGYSYTGLCFVAGVLSGTAWSDPGAANVLSGVDYYAAGAPQAGSLTLPPPSQVLAGTTYGVAGSDSTGTLLGGFVDAVEAVAEITIIRNCDHKQADGTAFAFTDPGTWPSLSGATVTLSIRQIGNNSDPAPLIMTASIVAGPPQVVIFEATHSETAALTPSTTADDYTFDIVAVLASGDRASLLPEGSATVICNVTGTGLPSGQPTPVSVNAGSQW